MPPQNQRRVSPGLLLTEPAGCGRKSSAPRNGYSILSPASWTPAAGRSSIISIEDYVEPVMPPSFVDEFIVPYDREVVRLIHSRGRRVVMHCHGRLTDRADRHHRRGRRATAPKARRNDIDLAGIIAPGGRADVHLGLYQVRDAFAGDAERVDEMVRQAVEMGGSDGRYVLSQAASPWMAELPGRTTKNLIHMIEAGAKYGGHWLGAGDGRGRKFHTG